MIRTLVVDDSAFNRVTLSRMLESSPKFEVVAVAVNGEEAIRRVVKLKPDLITLDLEMPVMDGFAFLRWLMANQPTPVIVVSSRSSDKSVFKALELGAIDFIAKPGGRVSPRLPEIQDDLLKKGEGAVSATLENLNRHPASPSPEWKGSTPLCVDLIVLGCSTGGPPALQHVFETLPRLEVPFVVAQHMPPTFTRIFAERLDRITRFNVVEGADGMELRPGYVYIAPGGQQTMIERENESGFTLSVRDRSDGELHAPSVDLLFESAAFVAGERLAAILMTGMGDDGARGMATIRSKGGKTIAEAPTTAVIFGMPSAAVRRGAVQQITPLQQIPNAILEACSDR